MYDNYSKLITATDTIRKMRANMDPLTPTTGTLGMAVGYIAETAAGLATKIGNAGLSNGVTEETEAERERTQRKRKERETVRWVLGTPRRLEKTLGEGKKDEAARDWDEVKGILEKWKGVKGVDELKDGCEKIMARS